MGLRQEPLVFSVQVLKLDQHVSNKGLRSPFGEIHSELPQGTQEEAAEGKRGIKVEKKA